jgi:integrase
VDEFAERDYFPMLEALAAVGRRSERNVDDERDRYRLHVRPRLGDKMLGEVTPQHLSELVAAMRTRRPKPYAEATIDNVLGVVRSLYRVARSRGYVSRSPVDGLDPAERPQPNRTGAGRLLDERQLTALVRHAPEGYRAVVTVLAYSGLRLSELLGLTWGDVDFVEREVHARAQLTMGASRQAGPASRPDEDAGGRPGRSPLARRGAGADRAARG